MNRRIRKKLEKRHGYRKYSNYKKYKYEKELAHSMSLVGAMEHFNARMETFREGMRHALKPLMDAITSFTGVPKAVLGQPDYTPDVLKFKPYEPDIGDPEDVEMKAKFQLMSECIHRAADNCEDVLGVPKELIGQSDNFTPTFIGCDLGHGEDFNGVTTLKFKPTEQMEGDNHEDNQSAE